jgi:hypothetical protein
VKDYVRRHATVVLHRDYLLDDFLLPWHLLLAGEGPSSGTIANTREHDFLQQQQQRIDRLALFELPAHTVGDVSRVFARPLTRSVTCPVCLLARSFALF